MSLSTLGGTTGAAGSSSARSSCSSGMSGRSFSTLDFFAFVIVDVELIFFFFFRPLKLLSSSACDMRVNEGYMIVGQQGTVYGRWTKGTA